MMRRVSLFPAAVFAAVALSAVGFVTEPEDRTSEAHFHSDAFRSAYGGLPDTTNSLFTGSGKCAGCHGVDPNHFANIAGQQFPAVPMPEGWQVNPTDDWRSTLMANSAKDPFWRAKVSHEVAINPAHQLELEDKCTSCHAPMGHFAAHFDGAEYYTMAELIHDSLALDGVSCNACHQQSPVGIGSSFSGELSYEAGILYGPYGGSKEEPAIYDLPMITYVGFIPQFGAHIAKSESCAGCHSLVTSTADLDGNPTGAQYIEQATYHEWLNSRYAPDLWNGTPNALQQECQGCHMPRIDDPVVISSGYSFLAPRTPFGLHYLVGGNSAMLRLMRNRIDVLGLTASEAQFDSTIARTERMLREETVDLDVDATWAMGGPAEIGVKLTNKAGHKFPSGYPARRSWIEVEARHPVTGAVVFHSGGLAANGHSIAGADAGGLNVWEDHHNVIEDEGDVQIYELVIADVTGAPTNVLERAAETLKDNRLVPLGFRIDHPVYDTTQVVGAAYTDTDFNRFPDGSEGSGTDVTLYRVWEAAGLDASSLDITVRVWYQSMPPRWVAPMFETATPEIAAFEPMFWEDGAFPVVVAEEEFTLVSTGTARIEVRAAVQVFPNPTSDGRVEVRLDGPGLDDFGMWEVYDASGTRVRFGTVPPHGRWTLALPGVSGAYILKVHPRTGASPPLVRRIVRT